MKVKISLTTETSVNHIAQLMDLAESGEPAIVRLPGPVILTEVKALEDDEQVIILADSDKIMKVLDYHRWKTMRVDTVQCECGIILKGPDTLAEFPADEAFRRHLANEVKRALP